MFVLLIEGTLKDQRRFFCRQPGETIQCNDGAFPESMLNLWLYFFQGAYVWYSTGLIHLCFNITEIKKGK